MREATIGERSEDQILLGSVSRQSLSSPSRYQPGERCTCAVMLSAALGKTQKSLWSCSLPQHAWGQAVLLVIPCTCFADSALVGTAEDWCSHCFDKLQHSQIELWEL